MEERRPKRAEKWAAATGRARTYVKLKLRKVSGAAPQGAVGGGHREEFPLAVIGERMFVMLDVLSAPQEGQVYIFH